MSPRSVALPTSDDVDLMLAAFTGGTARAELLNRM